MPSREFYLQEAKRLFDMALMARDPAMRGRWIERANDYLMLADALPDDPPSPPAEHPQAQQQPQGKLTDEDK